MLICYECAKQFAVIRDVKRSSNFQTLVLKFEFKFDLNTFDIQILD